MIDDYVPAQHKHNNPHRSTIDDYVPAQDEHNSPYRSTIGDYVPAQHEHNSPHRSTLVDYVLVFLLNTSILILIDRQLVGNMWD